MRGKRVTDIPDKAFCMIPSCTNRHQYCLFVNLTTKLVIADFDLAIKRDCSLLKTHQFFPRTSYLSHPETIFFCSGSVDLETGSDSSLPDQFFGWSDLWNWKEYFSGSWARIVDIQRIWPFFLRITFPYGFWPSDQLPDGFFRMTEVGLSWVVDKKLWKYIFSNFSNV